MTPIAYWTIKRPGKRPTRPPRNHRPNEFRKAATAVKHAQAFIDARKEYADEFGEPGPLQVKVFFCGKRVFSAECP